jgi:hypothetical protein
VIKVIFTLDYEIHGNGEGCPQELMIEPTRRLLDLFEPYGAKLTIMADVAEILKFKEYAERHGTDAYHYQAIVRQLQEALGRGHDVQLHLHSSYFKAVHDGRRWVQEWSEYDFASLSPQRLDEVIRLGRTFLESILRPVNAAYRCVAFRAANWSVSPSRNVVQALLANGFQLDSSVFKYGRREGLVNFDYADAESEMAPWRADEEAMWKRDPKGALWEVPIYAENRWVGAFFSLNRIQRLLESRRHKMPGGLTTARTGASGNGPPASRRGSRFLGKHAWKADFNQCTGAQLIAALKRGAARHCDHGQTLPFVLIGHSKLFTRRQERSLRPFLEYVAGNGSAYGFGTFDSLGLAN